MPSVIFAIAGIRLYIKRSTNRSVYKTANHFFSFDIHLHPKTRAAILPQRDLFINSELRQPVLHRANSMI